MNCQHHWRNGHWLSGHHWLSRTTAQASVNWLSWLHKCNLFWPVDRMILSMQSQYDLHWPLLLKQFRSVSSTTQDAQAVCWASSSHSLASGCKNLSKQQHNDSNHCRYSKCSACLHLFKASTPTLGASAWLCPTPHSTEVPDLWPWFVEVSQESQEFRWAWILSCISLGYRR